MAGVKISALTATTPVAADLVPFSQADGSASGRATIAQLVAAGGVLLESVADAKGDLLVASAADTITRLPVGTNGHVLTADSAESTGVKWAAAAGGGSVATDAIFDAKGDLPVGTGANAASKLVVGSDGQMLLADSAQSVGIKWVNAPQANRARFSFWGIPGAPQSFGTTMSLSSADTEYRSQFLITAPTNITDVMVEVTTAVAASTLRVGIRYDVDGLAGDIVWQGASTLDSSTTGAKTLSGAPLVVLQPGVYWSVVKPSTTGIAIRQRTNPVPGAAYYTWGDNNSYYGHVATASSGALATSAPAETGTGQFAGHVLYKWDQVGV